MTTKDDLVNIIKEWMELDDKIKELSNANKILKNKKKDLTASLVSIMKTMKLIALI